jgi:hypothetical protein
MLWHTTCTSHLLHRCAEQLLRADALPLCICLSYAARPHQSHNKGTPHSPSSGSCQQQVWHYDAVTIGTVVGYTQGLYNTRLRTHQKFWSNTLSRLHHYQPRCSCTS